MASSTTVNGTCKVMGMLKIAKAVGCDRHSACLSGIASWRASATPYGGIGGGRVRCNPRR